MLAGVEKEVIQSAEDARQAHIHTCMPVYESTLHICSSLPSTILMHINASLVLLSAAPLSLGSLAPLYSGFKVNGGTSFCPHLIQTIPKSSSPLTL